MSKIRTLLDLKEIADAVNAAKEKTIEIFVGAGTCGIAAGAGAVLDALNEEVKRAGLEKDVIVAGTGCIGLCYKEPLVEVRAPGKPSYFYGGADAKVAKEIFAHHILKGEPLDDAISENKAGAENEGLFKLQTRIALRNCGVINPESLDDYIAHHGYEALWRAIHEMEPQEVIKVVKDSGLRGRGGGGFPTGLKWELSRNSKSDKKYIICNADEGDPGAFMDRSVLEGDPHSVLEAMAIAGYAIGADEGVIYIRAEYPLAVSRLYQAIAAATERGLLGENIFGGAFSFTLKINLGAGAFVCGEETSLMNSVQGGRGEPRVKPPFPAQSGLWGKPTNINNVETYANICPIILKGSSWFASIGTEKSKGTKVFALAGKVNNVGLCEVPMGTTLRDILFEIGGGIRNGKRVKAVQTGGPSGGCIPAQFLDMGVDYDSLSAIGSMMGSGGMIVLDEDDCMVNIAKYYLEFTVDESCGRCTPCRIGNTRLYEILDRITKGEGKESDLDELKTLGEIIKDCSLCGLGQTAPNPVLSTMRYFMDEYEAHIKEKRCPAGACVSLMQYHINDNCVGCKVCAKNCPVPCIEGEVRQKHHIIQEKCIKCGVCYSKCRFKAIEKR